ncbi:hypothetical protein EIN_280120 [Entamoeba invadens IP1]|uniref:Uncharacterized protein n=1 Tax=Entamoeba invadens IP1 TaxID=370355 RepID=A0A0A1UDX8_ENTIV|nr:hypothetical protein EIN_280120 [Entamoeba invadens IP1]ELP90995.1 hypothetical protein EIN_280120 [Entamoeba invadens IP1]|eukprot:XP_004257766.1 hypothetical protein EIN_280120 [Entamoeba invadens IP1]
MNEIYGDKLKALINVKDTYSYYRDTCDKVCDYYNVEYSKMVKSVETLRNHPNVFAWYVDDETALCGIDEMTNLTMTIREKDINHPCYSVYWQYLDTTKYLPTFDAYGLDLYPINISAIIDVYTHQKVIYDEGFGTRSTWPVIQAMNYEAYYFQDPVKFKGKYVRAPTQQEMRVMTWLGFIGGAKGVFYYSFFDLVFMNDKGDPFEEKWKDVVKVTDEVFALKDVILSIEEAGKYSVIVDDELVVFLKKRLDKYDYLIIANGDEKQTRKISVELLTDEYEIIMGNGICDKTDHQLNIKINPIDVYIIKIKSKSEIQKDEGYYIIILCGILMLAIIILSFIEF